MPPRPRRRICKDCEPGSRREAKYPGPRCPTHHRERRAAVSAARKATYVENTWGITEEQYQAILTEQGGVCYGCRRAKGTGRRRLAVDHDHALARLHDHPEDKGCPECIRGLLCKPCNRNVLGHLRDELAAFDRFKEYLTDPPAQRVLRRWPIT